MGKGSALARGCGSDVERRSAPTDERFRFDVPAFVSVCRLALIGCQRFCLPRPKVAVAEFVEVWFRDYADAFDENGKPNLKPKSRENYHRLLDLRILPAIGHLMLSEVRPPVLIQFLKDLSKEESLSMKYRAKDGKAIKKRWSAAKLTAEKCGFNRHFMTPIFAGRNIDYRTAERFTEALRAAEPKVKVSDLFEKAGDPKRISTNLINHYFRCISTIMTTAMHWQLIESNPCTRVKAPSIEKKKIKFLEVDKSQVVLEAAKLLDHPVKRIALLIFLYTGIRKAELSGLRWGDFDFKNMTVTISRNLQQIDGQSMVEGPPKNGEERKFSITRELADYLREYKVWQTEQRLVNCW